MGFMLCPRVFVRNCQVQALRPVEVTSSPFLNFHPVLSLGVLLAWLW